MSRRPGGGHDHERVKVAGCQRLQAPDERVQASCTAAEVGCSARAWVWISEKHTPAHNRSAPQAESEKPASSRPGRTSALATLAGHGGGVVSARKKRT